MALLLLMMMMMSLLFVPGVQVGSCLELRFMFKLLQWKNKILGNLFTNKFVKVFTQVLMLLKGVLLEIQKWRRLSQ